MDLDYVPVRPKTIELTEDEQKDWSDSLYRRVRTATQKAIDEAPRAPLFYLQRLTVK
jgi:hypothetical protein